MKKMQYKGVLEWIDAGKSIPCTHFCRPLHSMKENVCLEKVLPVITAHAFCIQDAYNSLLDSLTTAEEAGGDDEVADDREFILAELLRLALNLDYADEIGRRRLEQFVRTCGTSVRVLCPSAELCWQDI